ncbi:MAG: asparagine synthase-related protein, partial [Egibacteraceae bacterium]
MVDADGRMNVSRVWTPERSETHAAQPLELVAGRLRDHLDDLAAEILARHENVACLFSGGLDSSLVAATLLRRAPDRVTLLNVGSDLGTAAEATLRDRLLADFSAVSHAVDLPSKSGLVHCLRAVNAASDLPTGSPFAHIFEEIITVARERGCDAIVTGDGGDEVFAEREDVLTDLLACRSRTLLTTAGYFALRRGERAATTLRHAWRRLRALDGHAELPATPSPGDVLLGEDLAQRVATARMTAHAQARELWAAGATCSGIGACRRATGVPEQEPFSSSAPGFPVISPLVDRTIVEDALALRRDHMVPAAVSGQPKWLLRQAALRWLSPQVALHPKIGSADGQILHRVRSEEHHSLLELLGGSTARSAGLRLSAAAEDPDWPLWHTDNWIRAAALVAWLDQQPPPQTARPPSAVSIAKPASLPPTGERLATVARLSRWQVALLAALNVAAQVLPSPEVTPRTPTSTASGVPPHSGLGDTLVDAARRACALPLVTGSSR